MFKQCNGAVIGKSLKQLFHYLEVLPVSGFSRMNLHRSSGRNRLLVKSVNDLLMVGINGSSLEAWHADKYVISRLKSGHHGALDKATGLPKKAVVVKPSTQLFMQ